MLTFSPIQFNAMSMAARAQFVDRVRRFLETDYPEVAPAGDASGGQVADDLIEQAAGFGIRSQEGVLRFIRLHLDYFVHESLAFAWADALLKDTGLPEEQKLLGLEHRLYGVPLWA